MHEHHHMYHRDEHMHHRHGHHHMHHRHDHELYHLVMPYIERLHTMHDDIPHMDEAELHHLTDRVMRDSGALHEMPQGHTEETVRDFIRALLLSHAYGDGFVEAMSPIVPVPIFAPPFPFFFPWIPFFPHPHRRPHGRPGGGHRGGGRRRR